MDRNVCRTSASIGVHRQLVYYPRRAIVLLLTLLVVTMLPRQDEAAGRQLSLPAIDLLPNAPTTYAMRDWRQTAQQFDALAFDTTATGQFLPIVQIDNTPVSQQLTTAFGLPAYVGETRTFGETGKPVHEAIASLSAVLGGTLVGIDKSAGPYNWADMTREYYVNRNSQFVVLNTPHSVSGGSAWYDVFPNILFYSIADRYPDESSLDSALNTIDFRFYDAVDVLTAGGTAPNFNYTAYDFRTRQPVYNGTWREPDMGLGMAWLQHAAYQRKIDVDPASAAQHLDAVDWSLAYYEQTTANPDYEILAPFGAYAAARMNAEHGRNYDIQKYVNWVFDRSNARPTKIMISGEQWGGEDVGGLMGFTLPNTSDVRGYAFSMNTFATALPMVTLARYEDRYSRAIGKWMLNAASAARLFYSDGHPPENQSSEFWAGDPNHAIAYEGLRHDWLPPHLLAPGENQEIYAAGDPLTYAWGPLTDYGIYGSAFAGVFGSLIKTTNVEKVLQLDLLATDFYRDEAYPTFLYYNPHGTAQSVNIDLSTGGTFDLYDAAANHFVAKSVSGQTSFNVAADDAVMLVVIPAGQSASMVGRQLHSGGVVIDYNATLLANNLISNPDVDAAASGGATPVDWHRSSSAVWASNVALSPTYSLNLDDVSVTRTDEWRSSATALPDGEDRNLDLRWFWAYDIDASDVDPGSEFFARLRFSADQVSGIDLTNPTIEVTFEIAGDSDGFEMFQTAVTVPDGIRSFDLTFISGDSSSDTGTLHVDDISAALVESTGLPGDFDSDGVADGADFLIWQRGLGVTHTAFDLQLWQSNFATSNADIDAVAVPEAATIFAPLWIAIAHTLRRKRR